MSEVINTKVYNGKFLDMYVDTYIDDKGNIKEWERCSRKGKTNAVMIVAKHIKTNKYIMISEFRIPINAREIGFPAGLIEQGETIEETVKREIKEETGLDLVETITVSPLVYNTSGMTDEAVAIAFVNVDGEISDKFLEPSEDIVPFVVSKEEMAKLFMDSSIKWGAKAWLICNMLIGSFKDF